MYLANTLMESNEFVWHQFMEVKVNDGLHRTFCEAFNNLKDKDDVAFAQF